MDPLTPKYYFAGEVYSARWLIDSVKEGRLLPKESYLSFTNADSTGCKRLGFGKNNVRYTITEAIKVFQIALRNKQCSKSAQFWMQVEREYTLPKRTADSLRNFWKTVERKGIENYMRSALDSNTWYCHSFPRIPKVQLVLPYRAEDMNGELERNLIRLAEIGPTTSSSLRVQQRE